MKFKEKITSLHWSFWQEWIPLSTIQNRRGEGREASCQCSWLAWALPAPLEARGTDWMKFGLHVAQCPVLHPGMHYQGYFPSPKEPCDRQASQHCLAAEWQSSVEECISKEWCMENSASAQSNELNFCRDTGTYEQNVGLKSRKQN